MDIAKAGHSPYSHDTEAFLAFGLFRPLEASPIFGPSPACEAFSAVEVSPFFVASTLAISSRCFSLPAFLVSFSSISFFLLARFSRVSLVSALH